MDTSLTDDMPVGHPLVLRVLVVAGALFGFTLLALAVSGAANATEGSPPPDRPGLLGGVGSTTHAVTSRVAPVVKPVTDGLEPAVAPVTRPVLHAAEPALSAVRPVTKPVLHALSPVTSPVLRATAPLTAPLVRAVGAEHVVPAVTGHPVAGQPAKPTPRGDFGSAPVVVVAPAGPSGPVVVERADSQRAHAAVPAAGHSGSAEIGVAGPLPGSGGGGLPADVSGVSGMSAGSGAQHGGEFAVTDAGSGVPGTDRTWRAPPAGAWSLHWLEYYGNDHPS